MGRSGIKLGSFYTDIRRDFCLRECPHEESCGDHPCREYMYVFGRRRRKEDSMITGQMVRQDLEEIRGYYEYRDEISKYRGDLNRRLSALAKKYEEMLDGAKSVLLLTYQTLYVRGLSQREAGEEWGYTKQYVYKKNKDLILYFVRKLNEKKWGAAS